MLQTLEASAGGMNYSSSGAMLSNVKLTRWLVMSESDKNKYSWKGSWDAGTALMVLVGVLTVVLFASGFVY